MQEQEQQIKEKIKQRYGKIALTGNSDCQCCATRVQHTEEDNSKNNNNSCCSSPVQQYAMIIGYDVNELQTIPKASVLGVGCGAPIHFADIHQGETVVDLARAGIDVDKKFEYNSLKSISLWCMFSMTWLIIYTYYCDVSLS